VRIRPPLSSMRATRSSIAGSSTQMCETPTSRQGKLSAGVSVRGSTNSKNSIPTPLALAM
jgi:hypothetical protein